MLSIKYERSFGIKFYDGEETVAFASCCGDDVWRLFSPAYTRLDEAGQYTRRDEAIIKFVKYLEQHAEKIDRDS